MVFANDFIYSLSGIRSSIKIDLHQTLYELERLDYIFLIHKSRKRVPKNMMRKAVIITVSTLSHVPFPGAQKVH